MGERHTWNHRVVRREYPEAVEDERVSYQIHEAHYEDGRCVAITVEPIAAYGADLDELRWVLERMLAALDKPILDYETRTEVAE